MDKQRITFNQQPIDRSEIEQSKLNIITKLVQIYLRGMDSFLLSS